MRPVYPHNTRLSLGLKSSISKAHTVGQSDHLLPNLELGNLVPELLDRTRKLDTENVGRAWWQGISTFALPVYVTIVRAMSISKRASSGSHEIHPVQPKRDHLFPQIRMPVYQR
jgi:hypothetical protein